MNGAKQKRETGELVTQTEAAKLLGVPPKAVLRLIERGILEPVAQRGTKRWFDLRDVSAASDALEQKLSFAGILETSVRAHTAATRVERKINALMEFFGMETLQPQPTKPQVEAHFAQGDRLALGSESLSPADMMRWAKIIMRIDSSYLTLVGHYLKKKEPWVVFLLGTDRALRAVPIEQMQDDPDTVMAVSMLSYARKCLVGEAYIYCRFTLGRQKADIKFPDNARGEMNDIIGALLRS